MKEKNKEKQEVVQKETFRGLRTKEKKNKGTRDQKRSQVQK